MKRIIVGLVFTCAIAAGAVAHAALDPEQETAAQQEANRFMAEARWKEALPIFAKLFAETSNPTYLWNTAACQYHLAQAGKATVDEALFLLRQYLDTPNLPDAKREKARRYLDDMEALKKTQAANAQATSVAPTSPVSPVSNENTPQGQAPPPVVAPSSPSVVAPSAPDPGPVTEVTSPPLAPANRNEGTTALRRAGLVVGGVGVVSVLTGAFFGYRAHSLEDRVTHAATFNPSDDSAGATANVMQYVFYAIGAAAVTSGGLLLLVGGSSSEGASPASMSGSTAFVPMLGSRSAGAVFQSRF